MDGKTEISVAASALGRLGGRSKSEAKQAASRANGKKHSASLYIDPKRQKQIRAHNIIRDALESGQLKQPANCAHCGATTKLDAHHFDYDVPLNVLWLCRSCHKKEHKAWIGQRCKPAGDFGLKLHAARMAAKESQSWLARKLGRDVTSISQWERGLHTPSPETQAKCFSILSESQIQPRLFAKADASEG